MPSKMVRRSWVTPLAAVSFAVVAVTGLLMLFHVRIPAIQGAHEWMGVVFALAGLLHLILNWRPLLACVKCRSAVAALAFCVLLVLAAWSFPHDEGHRHGRHFRPGHAAPLR